MTRTKAAVVQDLVRRWRRASAAQQAQQRRRLFQQGAVSKRDGACRAGYEHLTGTLGQQMRWQTVEALDGWLSHRVRDVRELINGLCLPGPDGRVTVFPRIGGEQLPAGPRPALVEVSAQQARLRHELHTVNVRQAWFDPGPVTMTDGTVIRPETRRLARRLFHQAARRHRWPAVRHVGMRLDVRGAEIQQPKSKTIRAGEGLTTHHFPLWISLATMTKGQRLQIPLLRNRHADARLATPGTRRVQGVQVIPRADGTIEFGLMSEVGTAVQASRAAYVPRTPSVSLDLGLTTLFATDQGDLLGRDWSQRLRAYDRQLQQVVRHRQQMRGRRLNARLQQGEHLPEPLRLSSSPRYQQLKARINGFLTTEVNRILNHLVSRLAPGTIVLESLDFGSPERTPGLSRTLRRLLRWMGRGVIQRKLQAFEEQYGLLVEWRESAYTSQECSSPACGYVDHRNRVSQRAFRCRWCGRTLHADVNGARVSHHGRAVVARGASAPRARSTRRRRQGLLQARVAAFLERHPDLRTARAGTGLRGRPADPRVTNPYFRPWTEGLCLSAPARKARRRGPGVT